MRKIIVLQSLLILVGAYYIFTLHQSTAEPVADNTTVTAVEPVLDSQHETATSTATTTSETEVRSDISGASDVGMEFPIPDNEADLQVR